MRSLPHVPSTRLPVVKISFENIRNFVFKKFPTCTAHIGQWHNILNNLNSSSFSLSRYMQRNVLSPTNVRIRSAIFNGDQKNSKSIVDLDLKVGLSPASKNPQDEFYEQKWNKFSTFQFLLLLRRLYLKVV